MPLLGFQKQFAPLVESGEKRQTIRLYRKDGRDPKVGDTLYFYEGLRTKQCRKLGEAVCIHVQKVTIDEGCLGIGGKCHPWWSDFAMRLAQRDGFDFARSMLAWFKKCHGLPFEGLLIRWGELSR